jgi:DNA replication and repair protein RecF
VQQLLETLQVTIFSPDDLVLIKGGPAERRRYLDDALIASRPRMLSAVQGVDRILRQRGVLLKQAGGRMSSEIEASLDVWDTQLATAGEELVRARRALVEELAPHTEEAFRHLTRLPASLSLSYRCSYDEPLSDALRTARNEDLRRGVTTVGPHRDDLYLETDGLDARTKLSQGRQRAATLALRLASHRVTAKKTGTNPVLLLDDAFSELDDATANALFDELPQGQAILTTAGTLPEGAKSRRRLSIHRGELSS